MKRIVIILSFLQFITPFPTFANNNGPDNRLGPALNLYHDARYSDAVEELKTLIGKAEENSSIFLDASYLAGMSYKELKDWKEAANWFQKASRHPSLADYALFHLGESYDQAGELELAVGTFRMLPSMFPESRWREESSFRAAALLLKMDRKNEARAAFETFIKDNGSSSRMPQALFNLAEILYSEGKAEEAFGFYKKVWLRFPRSSESKSSYDRMVNIVSTRKLSPPSLDDRYGRVSALLSMGSNRDGVKELLEVLRDAEKEDGEKPQWLPDARFKLAEAYYNLRDDEKGEDAIKELVEQKLPAKGGDDALFLYAKVLQRSGKRSQALTVYERITKEFPGRDIAARSLYRMADMAESDGELPKAREIYRRLCAEFPKSSLADDAIWKEGWLLYMEKKYSDASAMFQRLIDEYPASEFSDTVSYWSARTAERSGDREKAAAKYGVVLTRFPFSYYSILARGRLSSISPEASLSRSVKTVSWSPPEKKQAPDRHVLLHFNQGKDLLRLGFERDAAVEFSLAERRCNDRWTLLEIAGYQVKAGDYNRSQKVALNNFQEYLAGDPDMKNRSLWTLAYPLGFENQVRLNSARNSMDRYLVHAVIREESSYRFDAVSRAGAVGLMQIMPSTGSRLSKETGFKGFTSQSLYTPETNILFGSRYLKNLIKEYNGMLPLAIACYNAGPNAVSVWTGRYGTEEMDEFVERIPYSETRNYVKKVLKSYHIYERLYSTGIKTDETGEVVLSELLR